MNRTILTLFIISLILSGCSSGKKAYQRGDYYNATLQAANRLRSSPDNKKALRAIEDSYPMALSYFQQRIDQTLQGNSKFRYSEVTGYYQKMNHMADEVSRCPAALRIFPALNHYTAELAESRQLAAGEHYDAGLANERINTRLSWKEAYYNYLQADRFVQGYRDVRERMQTARFHATMKVVVEQIPVPKVYQLTSDFFLNQVLEALSNSKASEWVAYYSPASAEQAGIRQPDQLLQITFDDFVIGQIYDKETIRELSRDSVVVGTVTLENGSKQNVYNTVKAKLTTFRRELTSKGVLDVMIIDLPVNSVVSQRKFPGQYVWFSEWGSFNGDERALTKEQLGICKLKPVMPPPHQELFVEFTKPLYAQLLPFLKSFYSKY